MTTTDRHPNARNDLGHTAQLVVKLHPDLLAYVQERAAGDYRTTAEYVRQLIVTDMRADELHRLRIRDALDGPDSDADRVSPELEESYRYAARGGRGAPPLVLDGSELCDAGKDWSL